MTKNNLKTLAGEFIEDEDLQLTQVFLQEAYNTYHHSPKLEYIINGKVNELTRYSSWDLCYKHFQKFFKKKNPSASDRKNAGLHLGFYLASWGMFRNPILLNSGIGEYELLAKHLHDIKLSNKTFEESYDEIKSFLGGWKKRLTIVLKKKIKNEDSTNTLITKIMLGVYSNTPAFDRFFNKAVSRFYLKKNVRVVGTSGKKIEQKIHNIFAIPIKGKEETVGSFIKSLRKDSKEEFFKEGIEDIKCLDAIFFEIGRALFEAEEEN